MRFKISFLFAIFLWLAGCSSAPQINRAPFSQKEGVEWLQHFCSPSQFGKTTELTGDVLMKSSTKEFKGQYPASMHFERNGDFVMEVTHILGGTLMTLQGNAQGMDLTIPSKPRYNRKNIRYYLGLDLDILMQLLHGDLPCPRNEKGERIVRVHGNSVISESEAWVWTFERSTAEGGFVPVQVHLVSKSLDPKTLQPLALIDLKIEDWNRDLNYARKVAVLSPEGELKWSWRSRNQ